MCHAFSRDGSAAYSYKLVDGKKVAVEHVFHKLNLRVPSQEEIDFRQVQVTPFWF